MNYCLSYFRAAVAIVREYPVSIIGCNEISHASHMLFNERMLL